MGQLELDRVSSVNKKVQVEMKAKSKREKKKKNASPQQQNVDKQHDHRSESLNRQHDKDRSSDRQSLEEEYNRMFLRNQQNDAMALRKHNSDISDFITMMAIEDNLQSMQDEALPSEGDDSRRLRASESDLKALSGTFRKTCGSNRPRDYTEPTLDIDDMDCTYKRVKEILRKDMKGWEDQCACTSKKKSNSVKRKSSPWDKTKDIFSCDRTCSNKQKSQRSKGQREPAAGSPCCCKGGKASIDRRDSERKIDAACSPRESPCTPCGKCCSGSKVQVYQESDAVRSLSGAGQGCSSNICPPCQLCQQGCAALKLSPSEERIALERDMARCDCKRKLLKLRLMKAFNVCAKCRLPRTLCHCLEEIIGEYRRRAVDREIELKRRAQQNGSECTCEGDDPFAKLIHEVTNTCPKCGHWRTDCTCLEEMLIDVKRLMLKKKPQYENANDSQDGGNAHSCKCISQGRRGSRQNSMYQTTNVGNVRCSRCEGIGIEVHEPLENDEMEFMCTSKGQNIYNSSKTYLNLQISEISSPLQYSPSPQVQSNELNMEVLCDICSVCKKRTDSCDCNVLSAFIKSNVVDSVSKSEQIRSEPQERKRTERGTAAKGEMREGFCECIEEVVDETGKVRMCEECLRPKLHCVCKQSPTCYKCGKFRCDDFENPSRQPKFGSERPRSRTRHRYSESVRTAPNMNCKKTHQPIEIFSRQSPTEESISKVLKTKTCQARCSQSAFQKLKSHFRRCNSCGKKQAKKTNESKQTECACDSKDDKETNDNGKGYKKSRKYNKEKNTSTESAEVPLSSKRSQSMKRNRHRTNEK